MCRHSGALLLVSIVLFDHYWRIFPSDTPASIQSCPPLLAEHTIPVLKDVLGYDDDRIAALRKAGAFGWHYL